MAQPQIAHVAFGFALVAAARSGNRFAQIGAENVMIDVVATQRSGASPPLQVAPKLRSDVVGVVVIGRCTACPFITVEILAVTCIGADSEKPPLLDPSQRTERRGGLFELIRIVGGIESVGPEAPALSASLKVEESGFRRIVCHTEVPVHVAEVGIVDISVAATQRSGGEEHETVACKSSGQIGIAIPVLPAFGFEPKIVAIQRNGPDVDCTGIGTHSRNSLDEFDTRHAIHVDRQRMGLVSGAGIGEIDAVEQHHGLIGRSSADRDVCLHALAATLANVDRRAEAKGVFQRLERRGSLCTPIENGRLRLNAAGGTQSCPRHADRLDSHHAGYARGVGLLSRSRFSRQQENGHPDRKHPDRHLAVEAGEHGIVRTAPTLEARDRLRG